MGFNVEFNSILRSDDYQELTLGQTYSFHKLGSRVFFDNIPIWLTDSHWQVLAEVSIVEQTKQHDCLKGVFRVDYLYSGAEQKCVTDMFIRMYDGMLNPNIYLLSSLQEYSQAKQSGWLERDSLQTEGFIHASPRAQLNRVANKFYTQVESPLLIALNVSKITAPVKWEPATGGLYPHIYGPLNMDAVVDVKPITKNSQGVFDICTDATD